MNTFPRFSALFVVAFASASLVACAAPADSADATDTTDAPETTETTAQALVLSCNGTYTRPSKDGKGPLVVELGLNAKKDCTVAGYHLGNDHVVTSVTAGDGFRGTWQGDASAFVICSDAHCVRWTRIVAASER